MLLDVTKVTPVAAPPAVAWALLRDVPRFAACIPKVSDLQVLEADRRYAAVVADRLGPFGLQVPVRIEVQSIEEPRRIQAALAGDDSKGQARLRGTLAAEVEPKEDGSELTVSMRLEVLGRLAALGAAPMRRRAEEIFAEFARRLQQELSGAAGATHA